jgi:hypothetical protein
METDPGFEEEKSAGKETEQEAVPAAPMAAAGDGAGGGGGNILAGNISALAEPPREMRDIEDLLKASWQMLRERIAKFCAVTIVFIGLFVLVFVPSIALYALTQNALLVAGTVLLSCLAFLILALVQGIVFFELLGDKELRVRDAIRQAFSRLPAYIKLSLATLAVMVDFFLPLTLIGVLYVLAAATVPHLAEPVLATALLNIINWLAGVLVLLSLLAFVLLCLPFFLLFGAWENFAYYALLIEKRRVWESLAYAYGLVKSHKGALLWRIFVFWALGYLFLLLLGGILGGPGTSSSEPDFSAPLFWVRMFFSQLASLVITFWSYTFMFSLYTDLRALAGNAVAAEDVRKVKRWVKAGAAIVVLGLLGMILLGMILLGAYVFGNPALRSDVVPAQPDTTGGWHANTGSV